MEGGKDEVTRQGSLNSNGSRFTISHLTDHNNVGVSSQEGTHDARKIKSNLGFYLHLPQSGLGNLHRIFYCPDLDARFVDVPQGRVKCGGLARPGGSHRQYKTIGFRNGPFQDLQVPLGQPHFIDLHCTGTGQNSQYGILMSPGGREGG